MTSPDINTYREITPLIYSWSTPDIPKYEGWEKIGYTEQSSADVRISQQASQLSVEQVKVWSRRAMFTSEAGGWFTDKDFHAYLKQQGRFLADGRYELKVPYSVSRELLMDVLHYGSDAEIVEPQSLREQAKALLSLALSNYD